MLDKMFRYTCRKNFLGRFESKWGVNFKVKYGNRI